MIYPNSMIMVHIIQLVTGGHHIARSVQIPVPQESLKHVQLIALLGKTGRYPPVINQLSGKSPIYR